MGTMTALLFGLLLLLAILFLSSLYHYKENKIIKILKEEGFRTEDIRLLMDKKEFSRNDLKDIERLQTIVDRYK
ncbi:hypothetical protein [Listeria ilorinensis]|uniref:hypothetical protein n=1 Tax=Listeria ilorinensis TaxID=2867439 RepID=UPI001EF4CB52|nr:hypothetical protein [Listeria ilorinensis]